MQGSEKIARTIRRRFSLLKILELIFQSSADKELISSTVLPFFSSEVKLVQKELGALPNSLNIIRSYHRRVYQNNCLHRWEFSPCVEIRLESRDLIFLEFLR